VANDHRLVFVKRVEHTGQIRNDGLVPILARMQGPIAPAVAAHVDRNRSEPGVGDHRQLMAPGVPEARKTMTKQHGRPFALGDRVDPNAVGFNLQMLSVAHGLCVLTATGRRPR
jgi:hypothetical protein